jgi:hypothetical protein
VTGGTQDPRGCTPAWDACSCSLALQDRGGPADEAVWHGIISGRRRHAVYSDEWPWVPWPCLPLQGKVDMARIPRLLSLSSPFVGFLTITTHHLFIIVSFLALLPVHLLCWNGACCIQCWFGSFSFVTTALQGKIIGLIIKYMFFINWFAVIDVNSIYQKFSQTWTTLTGKRFIVGFFFSRERDTQRERERHRERQREREREGRGGVDP